MVASSDEHKKGPPRSQGGKADLEANSQGSEILTSAGINLSLFGGKSGGG